MTGLILKFVPHFETFALVFLRVSVLVLFFPLFDSRMIPTQIKVFAVLVLSLVLTPVVQPLVPAWPRHPGEWVILLGKEACLGVIVFLGIHFVFAGVQIAGELAGIQMGFGFASIVDPQAEGQSSILGVILNWVAVLLFLAVDGHHFLLRMLVESFTLVPLGGNLPDLSRLPQVMISQGAQMFSVGFKMLAPVLAVIFLIQVALGLMARTVTQIQVMLISFPLTIILGLFFLALTLPLAIPFLNQRFTGMAESLGTYLRLLQG